MRRKKFSNAKRVCTMSNKYNPSQINIDEIVLPPNLTVLVEKLSENIHDIWAKERLSDGWSYGAERDDTKKKHPCLVPYAALPENEKKYDREIIIGVLKTLIKLGYIVSPKDLVDNN